MRVTKVFATIMLLVAVVGFAQNASKKWDKIIKRDYQIIECSIAKMSDKTIEYSLPGEKLLISLDIAQIARIDFASGRSQTFDVSSSGTIANTGGNNDDSVATSNSNANQVLVTAEMKPNTIAVLPVPYLNADNLQSSEEMSKFAQNDLYNKLLDKSSNIFPLTVQDLRITNNLLRKAGIDYKNIDEIPIEDLQRVLGVDNIVAVKVSFTTTESSTALAYNGGNAKISDNKKKVKTNDYSIANTSTRLNYDYTVYFDMYKNNTKIYSQTREPFFSMKDSWMDSITYLLKRSPIYTKK